MGKFKRYFDPNEGSKQPDKDEGGNTDKSDSKSSEVKIETIYASKRPKKLYKNKLFKKKKDPKAKGGKQNKDKALGDDPFPEVAPVSKRRLNKYSRGQGLSTEAKKKIKTKIRRKKIQKKDEKIKTGIEQAARAELLLLEPHGTIEVEDWESTLQLKQCDIKKHVDVASASKSFELNLEQFGPYKIDYTLNGRHLVLGGRKGHIAALDWVTKTLMCEVSVNESIHDVQWLHNEMMFAVAQKEWTYIYDNQGIEIHCLKKLDRVYNLDFLPYHFLLVGAHQSGFLSWVDVSIGKIVAQFRARHGTGPPPTVMATNPANAVTFCGHANGVVTLWAPSVKQSLASVLCHGSPISSIAIDSVGRLMATSGNDGFLRLWDLRNNFTPLTSCKVGVASAMDFSQRGLLSLSTGNQTLIFTEVGRGQKPYLKHVTSSIVSDLSFCPFEDILGLGTQRGFQSILVPGSGEANYDALERNPFQTKSQRREAEVKSLLEKIQPELITLDNSLLGEVDVETLGKSLDQKPKYIKKADLELSHRKKRKNAKIPKIKQGLQSELNIKHARELQQKAKQDEAVEGDKISTPGVFADPLDRFTAKKKKK